MSLALAGIRSTNDLKQQAINSLGGIAAEIQGVRSEHALLQKEAQRVFASAEQGLDRARSALEIAKSAQVAVSALLYALKTATDRLSEVRDSASPPPEAVKQTNNIHYEGNV
jgi:hypothetical protein